MNTNQVQTALAATSRKLRFQAADNSYRYWFTPAQGLKHSVLKIQVCARQLAAFRRTRAGQAAERQADIMQIGGGWYEIVGRDLSAFERAFGSQTDGTMVWLKQWNLFHLAGTNANPDLPINIERVKHIASVDQHNPAKPRPVWSPTPEQRRNEERFQAKVMELASKFART